MTTKQENKKVEGELCLGAISKNSKYSTHFNQNFNVDGSPDTVSLESIFNNPQDNIENIVGYSKYCYRKYGIITRVVNIVRDFGTTNIKLSYPTKDKKIKKCIDDYNDRININQLISDFNYELALTGNLACYDRDGVRVDIYPINKIEPVPLVVDNKQIIAYKNDSNIYNFNDYGDEINNEIDNAYPPEILEGMKSGKSRIILNSDNAYFGKINCSQYESYGMSIILPAFEDLAHKNLLKEAEKATANDVIDKIMLIKIGDKDNKPNRQLINDYTDLLNGLKGSVRLTVPYYVDVSYVEPETSIFQEDKFVEVDTDILNALGVSLSLIRGESGGNYAEGMINFSGLTKTIENIQKPIKTILNGLYRAELKRKGFNAENAPKVEFGDVVIDKEAKLGLVKELFTTAGLPYRLLYEESGYDFDSIKIMREQENEEKIEDVFKLRSLPWQGENTFDNNTQQEGGGQTKTLTERKTDKTQSNNSQPRTSLSNSSTSTNRSYKK